MPNEEEDKAARNYKYLVMLLGMATIVLAAATVYMMEVLGVRYGVNYGVSGLIMSGVFNKTVTLANQTAILAQTTVALNSLHDSMRVLYLIFLISLGMLGASFVLYTSRSARFGSATRRYTLMHTTLTVIYIAMFFVAFSSNLNQVNFGSLYFILVYFAMGAALAIDAYLEFGVHGYRPRQAKRKGAVRIEPETPYTNLIKLREDVFSSLHNNVRIVDRHFNSIAISNLHRLLEGNRSIKKIDVLTSREMFDSRFLENYNDFKKELNNAGVELNFMLMDDADSTTQHERFIFDETAAYKIPPLNIINKKSEHVVGFNLRDAKNRFESLSRNAIKYENYLVKQARVPEQT